MSRASGRRFGGLLWQRDFRLFWIGETTSQLGSTITLVVMPLVAVIVLHASTLVVGLLSMAAWLPTLLIGLPAGAWVDRLPCRAVMLGCDGAAFALFASVPVASWLGLLTVGWLLVVALLTGISRVLFFAAYGVYLPALVTAAELPEGNATIQGSAQAAQVGGRGLGGLFAQLFGPVTALLADAASFLVSAACLLAIRTGEARPARVGPVPTLRADINQGLWFVLGDRYLRVLAVFIALTNMALIGFLTLEVVFLVRDVGVEPAVIGALVAASSVGGVVGAVLASPIARRVGTARGVLVSVLATAPLGLLIPLARPGLGLLLLIVGYLATGAGIAAANVILTSFVQTYSPPGMLGRTTATIRFLVQGAIPLAALLAGVLGNALGNRATLWIIAATLIGAALLLLASPLRKLRDLPTTAATHPATNPR